MTEHWTVHTETGRLFRPIYNLSGKNASAFLVV